MKANRLLKLAIIAALIVTAFVVVLSLNVSGSAREVTPTYVGMGDLRRYEAQGNVPGFDAEVNNRSSAGMGDLRLYEHLQDIQSPE